MKAEIGVIKLKPRDSKYCQKSPEAKREAWDRLFPITSERAQSYQHCDFRFLASSTVRKDSSVVLSHSGCDTFLQQPNKTNTQVI